VPELPSTTARYTRGAAAAVVAVVTLVLAANAGPARAADESSPHQRPRAERIGESGDRLPGPTGASFATRR
jgi:hypothetical protein